MLSTMRGMFRSSLRTSPVARPPSFGRRGVQEDRFAVAADDIWRGVAALHKLSAEAQLDREVRSACLVFSAYLGASAPLRQICFVLCI